MTDEPRDPRPFPEQQQLPDENELDEEPEDPDAPVNDPPHMPPATDDDFLPPAGMPVL